MRLTPGALLLSFMLLGCGSVSPNRTGSAGASGGGHPGSGGAAGVPSGAAGSTGAAGTSGASGTAGAAGGAGTTGADMTTPFVGDWKYSTGSINQDCNLTIPAVDLTGDTITIVKVDDTHIDATWSGTAVMCSIEYSVAGNVATAATGQTCTETISVNLSAPTTISMIVAVTSSTLTLTNGVLVMALTGTGTADGGVLSCTPTGTGSATSF